MADAEIHWPSITGSRFAGQIWAVEVELTPKPIARTTRIMADLLTSGQYAQVIYLTAPKARSMVTRAAAELGEAGQLPVAIRDLPQAAFAEPLAPPRVRAAARARGDDDVGLAEADHGPLAGPRGGQGGRVAGPGRDGRGRLAGDGRRGGRVSRARGGGAGRRPGCTGRRPGRCR